MKKTGAGDLVGRVSEDALTIGKPAAKRLSDINSSTHTPLE
jgi:hypothetical protein